MRQFRNTILTVVMTATALLATACSTTSKTMVSTDESFKSFLVIGVAQDYDSRAQFERMLVRDIAATGVSASTYHSVVGGNKPIDRETIEALIAKDGYDAVLIARVTHSEADAKAKTVQGQTRIDRKDDGFLHLFRYDYTDLNEAYRLEFDVDVALITEIFDTDSGERVWAIESELANREVIFELIEDAADEIVRRMKRDDLIPG